MSWWDNLAKGMEDLASFNLPGAFGQFTGGTDPITSWISTQAGNIASGIEGAFTAFLTDLWDVVLGPLEIIIGAIIFLMGLTLLVKDDLTGIMGVMAMAR